ncbi:MAG TPA: alpha/beta hydrolase [Gemmataceae bacterium]|nr:alpha/beta hydrolase [Gemmataceae bacterium]
MNKRAFFALILASFLVVAGIVAVVAWPYLAANPEKEIDPSIVVTEEVRFKHGKDVLAGTLYMPAQGDPHPAVALVLGSGKQDRNYSGIGPALGNHFAQHGFACLAWDKPGVGQSTGDFNAQTFQDRAEEANAAIEFLRGRNDIRSDRIGVWGHSQGGMVAPLAASLCDKVAFLIEVSGWQGPTWQQDQIRVEAEMSADGFSAQDVQIAGAFAKTRMDMIRGDKPFEDFDKLQHEVKTSPWFEYLHYCDRDLFYSARLNTHDDSSSWWEGVHCPVLVIFGNKDTSSGPPEPLVAIIRCGLAKAGNKEVTAKIFANADHSLCRTQTGGPKEARDRDKTKKKETLPDFVDGYLETMTDWLEKQVARTGS